MTRNYFAAAVLLILAFLGYLPEGLLGLPLLLGITDGEGGDEGGGNEGGGGDGGEQLDLGDVAAEGAEAAAAAAAEGADPSGTERWDDKMKRLRAEVAAETAAAAAGAEGGDAGEGAQGGEGGEGGDGEGAEGGQPDGEGGKAEGADGKGEGDDDLVFVALPGRRPEDGDFELPIDVEFLEALEIDPADVVERVNQLRNGYAYRKEAEEIRTSAENQLQELDGIYEAMAEDPAGFLIAEVKPELRASVVEELVLELTDAELTALLQKAQGYVRDPDKRELAKSKAQLRRTSADRDRLASSSSDVKQQEYTKNLRLSIASIVPEATPKARADLIVRTAARELQLYAAQHKLTTLDPAKVPEILAEIGVLETFGLTVPNGNGGDSSSAASPPPKKAAPPKPAAKAPAKPPVKGAAVDRAKAVDVRDRLKRRKAAATTTPAGAGSATPPGFQKVPGEKHLDRRNRLARALGLPEKKEL